MGLVWSCTMVAIVEGNRCLWSSKIFRKSGPEFIGHLLQMWLLESKMWYRIIRQVLNHEDATIALTPPPWRLSLISVYTSTITQATRLRHLKHFIDVALSLVAEFLHLRGEDIHSLNRARNLSNQNLKFKSLFLHSLHHWGGANADCEGIVVKDHHGPTTVFQVCKRVIDSLQMPQIPVVGMKQICSTTYKLLWKLYCLWWQIWIWTSMSTENW